jgi:hypothetical protein
MRIKWQFSVILEDSINFELHAQWWHLNPSKIFQPQILKTIQIFP